MQISAEGHRRRPECRKQTDTANNKVYRIVHNNGYKSNELAPVDMSGFELYLNTDLDGNNITKNAPIQRS